jgi:hypothetical protein
MADGLRQMYCSDCNIEWTAICCSDDDAIECPSCETVVCVEESNKHFEEE